MYLDVATPTSLRPDGHHLLPDGTRDCGEYCAPGPVDHWVALLQNVLQLLHKHQSSKIPSVS